MKKLKVTWHDGPWPDVADPAVASQLIPQDAVPSMVGETLVFKAPSADRMSTKIVLMVPDARLISVIEVEADDA